MSSFHVTEEQVEKAARQIRITQSSDPEQQARSARWWDEGLTAPDEMENCRRQARAVLVAVGPMIAAQGVREYVAAARENGWIGTWDAFDALNDAEQWADTIEKEAGR